jgi:hypothetical protein
MVHQQEDDFFDGYESTFEHAVEELKQAGAEKKVSLSDAHKLQLYSLYKQALEGDCKKSQPSKIYFHSTLIDFLRFLEFFFFAYRCISSRGKFFSFHNLFMTWMR